MIKLKINGIDQIYVSKNEIIPAKTSINDVTWKITSISPFMREYIHSLTNTRSVIVPISEFTRTAVVYYAWFVNETTPLHMEKKLNNGKLKQEQIDDYFSQSAFLQYQITCCIKGCKNCYHTLILPRFLEPITATPDVEKDKYSKMFQILSCPNCGNEFSQNVVQILDQVEE